MLAAATLLVRNRSVQCADDVSRASPLVVMTGSVAHQARVVRVLALTAFKLKYTDSALGYFWSLARPLALFGVLYVVFGRALGLGTTEHYPVFLLLGVVLYTFFSDATMTTMISIVEHNSLLRKVAFERLIIPVSSSVTALINFGLNLLAIVAFAAWEGIVPGLDWLLLIPLFLELYVFVLGVSLILATLFARLRDVGDIWEVALRVFFYAFAIIFPLQLLPLWAQRVIVLNPFAQVMQDVRAIVLGGTQTVTVTDVLGGALGLLAPLAIAILLFVGGIVFFKREEHWFAEQV
jgi:ABC-2 type transport system permease protein